MTTATPTSSWITDFSYRHFATTGESYLAIFTSRGEALLYSGIPSRIPGLLAAGTGRRSVGRAYNSIVKGRYPYQRVTEPVAVQWLRRMMQAEVAA